MKKKKSADDRDIVNTLVKKQKLVDKKWPDEMTPEAARRIEKLQEQWREDSLKAQREQAEEVRKRFSVHPRLDYKPKNEMHLPPPRDNRPLTVKEARKLDKLQDQLKREFQHSKTAQVEEKRELEKQHEPVIKAIKEQTETIKSKQRPQLVKKPAVEQFRPRSSSTPGRSKPPERRQSIIQTERETPLPEDEEMDVFEAPTMLPPTPVPTGDTDELQNRSIRQFTENENIGSIAKEYLKTGNDRIFGIYYDFENSKLAIGSQTISIENNDIILDDTVDRYQGTEGLWKLLTKSEIQGLHGYNIQYTDSASSKTRLVSAGAFTEDDFEKYKDILIKTNAIYRNNNPATRRPKSSGSWKWVNIVSGIWKEFKQHPTFGKGLLVDTNNAVEYKYVDDIDKLCDRIQFIQAEEAAGNNSFHNEKLGIAKFVSDKIEKLITEPEGAKYVQRCLSVLPDVKGGRARIASGLTSFRKKQMRLFGRR